MLLLLSAVFYALPFLYGTCWWWTIPLYPIFFFYGTARYTIGFKPLLFWGVCVYTLHLSGVLFAIVSMARGAWWYAFIPATGIVLQQALCAAFFLWCVQKLISYFFVYPSKPGRSRKFVKVGVVECSLLIWTIALWLYTFWADQYCLFLFGKIEGYQFMHPLVPLVHYPPLLRLLPIVGKKILSIFFFSTCAATVLLFLRYIHLSRRATPDTPDQQRGRCIALIIFVLSLLPWIVSLWLPTPPVQQPDWLNQIMPLPVIFPRADNVDRMIQVAGDEFKNVAQYNSTAQLIVLPESSFYDDQLATRSATAMYWSQDYVGKPVNVLVGAFRRDGDQFYNCLYWYKDGTLQMYFDKRHTMILTERIPQFLDTKRFNDLYFGTYPQRQCGCQERMPMALLDNQRLVPYVCSELFFNDGPDDIYSDTPILLVSNDMWFDFFGAHYMQDLMETLARFKALQWQRDIVYTSVSRALFIAKNGEMWG